jgi:guanylate kinase
MKKHEPLIFIISAPSGTGKGTIVERILAQVPSLRRVVTATTRAKRDGEVEGVSYIYLSETDFLDYIEKDEFVEWNRIYGNNYGTMKKTVYAEIERGRNEELDFVVEIDVDGKRNFSAVYENNVSIFLMPPSIAELKQRILGRKSENDQQLKKRLGRAEKEIARKDEFDYIVVNDDIDKATAEVIQIIENERKKNR